MIQIEEKEIVKGIDEAYKRAGSNAYFGNGFQAGVDFALKQVKKITIPVFMQSLPKRLSNAAYLNAREMRYEDFVTWWDKQV